MVFLRLIPGRLLLVLCLILGLALDARTSAQTLDPAIPYVPTPDAVVNLMLKLGDAGPGDVHYDLGSGDGRFVIAAICDFDVARSVGIDINPRRIRESRENAQKAGVSGKTRFILGDLFKQDLIGVDVLTLYLSPEVNRRLRPKILSEMAPGARVVSHDFRMGDWEADAHQRFGKSDIYMWVVPAEIGGAWRGTASEGSVAVDFRQKYQELSGLLEIRGQQVPLQGRLDGKKIRFHAVVMQGGQTEKLRFTGQVADDGITGRMKIDGESQRVSLQPLG